MGNENGTIQRSNFSNAHFDNLPPGPYHLLVSRNEPGSRRRTLRSMALALDESIPDLEIDLSQETRCWAELTAEGPWNEVHGSLVVTDPLGITLG